MTGRSSRSTHDKRGTRRPGKGGGFTLIELVVVMVILGVLAVAVSPSLASLGNTRTAFAARQVCRDLTFARQRAAATGTICWVQFDAAGQNYVILAEDPDQPGLAFAGALTDPATGRDFEQSFDEGDLIGVQLVDADFDGETIVGFDWLGRPLNAGESLMAAEGVITLSGGYEVTIEAGTGLPTLIAP